ncbi:hypothetical protein CAter282_0985 [Collimonas arenae]|uniref:Uncharacterized protein n=1 Tax=Collimonas arenae TaxID=279058 RepID=A0A127QFG5_9BURK|nr:hypothetical protein [Collimonas arenae]AMO98891.1 hypothetical protein CAter10_1065 [Collimonas arenae]AMP08781.1 hypothetical protein CAter282_0985 [Collimonas arenae]
MDSIPFEKVSVSEAKSILDKELQAKQENNWESLRRLLSPADLNLQKQTYDWLIALPTEIWPLWLIKHYPRIANHFAEVWRQRSSCEALFSELLLDQRGARTGFPVEVSREIMALKQHFDKEAAP